MLMFLLDLRLEHRFRAALHRLESHKCSCLALARLPDFFGLRAIDRVLRRRTPTAKIRAIAAVLKPEHSESVWGSPFGVAAPRLFRSLKSIRLSPEADIRWRRGVHPLAADGRTLGAAAAERIWKRLSIHYWAESVNAAVT